MSAIHSHNSTSDPYYILGIVDTVEYGFTVASEQETLSRESAAMLAEICNSVSDILPDFEADLGDFAADMDEMS